MALFNNLDTSALVRAIGALTGSDSASILDTAKRDPTLVACRWTLWSVLRHLGASFPEIGRRCNMNHSTVIKPCDLFLSSPRILTSLVHPLAVNKTPTMTPTQAHALVTKGEPLSPAWSLYPDWCPRRVAFISGTTDEAGITHPQDMVFQSEVAAQRAAFEHISPILTCLGMKIQ
jgi:hypothetical protein